MINPNICKFVVCEVANNLETARYRGLDLPLSLYNNQRKIKPGKRRLYLKYSILSERYYLTNKG